jgi:hypothetical protein
MEAIRKNWSNGKIKNILGREPDQRLRLTNTQKFDVAVEQGSYSTTQKQMELRQLLHFREMGIAISDGDILSAATIQNKDKIIERQQQQAEQQAQQEQQIAQQQEQQSANQKMLDFAKAQRDLAGARDLQASAAKKTVEIEEISSSAEQNRTQADLNLVKQLVELEDMDMRQLKESLELADLIKEKTQTAQNLGSQLIPIQQEA